MSSTILPPEISARVAKVYEGIQQEYDRVAGDLQFTCEGCPDNCCDSYFLHHTYTEWAYLWEGLSRLPEEKRAAIAERARSYKEESQKALAADERPQIMCPLNEDGLCLPYEHRLLICRLHGVPAAMTRPDGKRLEFPGCFRCQEIAPEEEGLARMDRTPFFREFIAIEMEWLGVKRQVLPKVKMTIAEMIIKGPPQFSYCKL
ncbi:MAG: hypothetical protein ABFR97_03095 [Thermodesulfobacteriota bacterium]